MNLLTKEFETSKCRVLAINLPDGAEPELWNEFNLLSICKAGVVSRSILTLPPGKWEILEVTEEKAREVVPMHEYTGSYVIQIDDVDQYYVSAKEAFESLIKSQIKTVNKYGEKPEQCGCMGPWGLPCKFSDWQSEQATVFDNPIYLISKK